MPIINLLIIFISTMMIASILTIISLKSYIKLSDLIDDFIYGMPFYVYLCVIFAIISLILSIFFYYGLRSEQQLIVKKMHWIIMGNYSHPIFQQKNKKHSLFSSHLLLIDEQVHKINEQLNDISNHLKKFSEDSLPLSHDDRLKIITDEKNRIARELHDSVSQQLYAATMMISSLPFTIEQLKSNQQQSKLSTQSTETISFTFSQLDEQIVLIGNIITEAQNELRALLLHLRPIKLKDKTLAKGIITLLEELKTKTTLDIFYDINEVPLHSNVEDHLFRVLQELISNVLRHSKATHLEIYLQQVSEHIILRVFDNGTGFNVTKTSESSYGLSNIKERITSLGGSINITSLTNQGTAIDIRI